MKTTVPLNDSMSIDPISWGPMEVEMLPGYYRVFSGALKPADLYLNMVLLADGIVAWESIDASATERRARSLRVDATQIPVCVIRLGSPVEKACERCGMDAVVRGERFCSLCRAIILNKIRSTH